MNQLRWFAIVFGSGAVVLHIYLFVLNFSDTTTFALRPRQISIELAKSGGAQDGYVEITGGVLIPPFVYNDYVKDAVVQSSGIAYLLSEASLRKWNETKQPGKSIEAPADALKVGMNESQVAKIWPMLTDDAPLHTLSQVESVPLTVRGELATYPRPSQKIRGGFEGISEQFLEFEKHSFRALSINLCVILFESFVVCLLFFRGKPKPTSSSSQPYWVPETI